MYGPKYKGKNIILLKYYNQLTIQSLFPTILPVLLKFVTSLI